jgi:6-phosphogluconolactonase
LPAAVYVDRASLMRATAERIVDAAGAAIGARGRFTWVLSGGNTPRQLYALLGSPEYAARIDWTRVHLFWGDERCVPPDHPDSNYRMVAESLLVAVDVPKENVHRMYGEREPAEAAQAYESELRLFFPGAEGPRFDWVLLGMGDDGHTASLFPGSPALAEKERWVSHNWVQKLGVWRLTLTTVALNSAAQVVFLVAGADKASRLVEIFSPDISAVLPVQLIAPVQGKLAWLVDEEAGALLPPEVRQEQTS